MAISSQYFVAQCSAMLTYCQIRSALRPCNRPLLEHIAARLETTREFQVLMYVL